MNKVLEKSLLNKVERLEAFEERASINFENLSIKVSSWGGITIFFEVYPKNGSSIPVENGNINLECILYGKENKILETDNRSLYPEDFFGFELVKFIFNDENIADEIKKIRIYPKIGS
ncbi:hypothetical protein [Polaribacter sp. IC063]|uniref:hypothetical protein n=1 Tax=Polaribacter sp. IC063 TaxID=57031 RepID=UPI0011BF8EE3|nr:hypothetical protein [Polaribacter sp. IC063]TXD50718.1 hypothetical protein ES043_15110 [Polaribacter sp. IC063]